MMKRSHSRSLSGRPTGTFGVHAARLVTGNLRSAWRGSTREGDQGRGRTAGADDRRTPATAAPGARSESRCQVIGDHGRLVQVLANLLGNASRYTPEGGRIDIELVREEADAVVRVRDTGMGIAPEMLDRIFDMFDQGGKPPGSGAGLGLGLALARQLAQLHGGHLTVDSPGLGRGACFTLRLPLQAGMPCELSASRSDFVIAAPLLHGRDLRHFNRQARQRPLASVCLWPAGGGQLTVASGG